MNSNGYVPFCINTLETIVRVGNFADYSANCLASVLDG